MKILEQLPEVATLVMSIKEGYDKVIEVILPRIQAMIQNISKKVSDKAVEVMLKISQRLTDEDRGKYILTDVLSNHIGYFRTGT
jgi:hypothetical protein